jgi:hypothetical protein
VGSEDCHEWRNYYRDSVITPMAKVTERTKVRNA